MSIHPIHFATPDELLLLRSVPYEKPRPLGGTLEVRIADRLIERGLLERDPSAPGIVRCTDEGMNVARPITRTQARMHVHAIRVAIEQGDRELAASIERTLRDRILAEIVAASFTDWRQRTADILTQSELADLARIALSTRDIKR